MDRQPATINIAMICDDNYALCTGVAITSLKTHRAAGREYCIYIHCDGVLEEKKNLFLAMSEPGFEIRLIDVVKKKPLRALGRMAYAKHVSPSALYKFDLPQTLGRLDKVLYLDGDLIIRDSLEDLYDLDISDCYAAVCKDIGAETYPSHYNSRLKIQHSGYFNSGVMLLNLKMLRRDKISDKLLEYKLKGINHFMDQDAFNVVFQEKVKYFSFLYNMGISCWRDRSGAVLADYYDLPGYSSNQLFREAKILHLSAPEKPWLYYDAIAAEEWFVHFIRSPFRQMELNRRANPAARNKMTTDCNYREICYGDSYRSGADDVLVSVVIPVYNAEKYLHNCVESLMSQTLTQAEFIFVDDESSDSSVSILKHYQKLDDRIQIYQQKNARAGIARNNGMSHATGKYITFLDSDDIMLPDALEAFFAQAEKTNADIVISAAYYFSDDVKKRIIAEWCLRENYLPKTEVFSVDTHAKYIFQVSAGAPWGKLYRSSFLREHGLYFPNAPRAEDFFFVYWAFAAAERITTTREKTVLYRIVAGNGSLEDQKDRYPTAQSDVRKQLWEKLNEIGVYNKVEQSFINNTVNGLVYHLRGFKTAQAFEALYNEFKNVQCSLFKINMENEAYYYSKSEYTYLKKVYDSDSAADFWSKQYRRLKNDTDYYLGEPQKTSAGNIPEGMSVEAMARELAFYRSEIDAIHMSWSYRIGRLITWLPRMVRGGIRCYHEHGARYTWERILIHLHLKREWNAQKKVFPAASVKAKPEPSRALLTAEQKANKDYDYYYGLSPDKYKEEVEEWYKRITGEKLDLDAPKTFNEKIQWLKLYDSTPLKTRLADKYLVRDWVKEKIGEEYLIPLLGAWESFDEIDFDRLPDQFALKANHGSGWNVIVKDKAQFDKETAKKKFDVWMKKNFAFVYGLELHYMNIPPKIIAEQYIQNADGLIDYRFYCFNGKPAQVWVDIYSGTARHMRSVYDMEWNLLPLKCTWPEGGEILSKKPKNFEKMKEFAALLSEGFAFVRVDFFEVDEQLYMGEMTFTPMGGTGKFEPKDWDFRLGEMLMLPDKSPVPERKF